MAFFAMANHYRRSLSESLRLLLGIIARAHCLDPLLETIVWDHVALSEIKIQVLCLRLLLGITVWDYCLE